MAASLAVLRSQIRRTLLNVKSLQECKIAFYNTAVTKNKASSKTVTHSDVNVTETVEYPPVKPRFPPGKWGDIDSSDAWEWQTTIDDLWDIPDIKGRQAHIIQNEMSHVETLPDRDHPDYLEFAKYVTKSAMRPWSELPSSSHSNNLEDDLMKRIKGIIIDQILIEHEAVEREIHPEADIIDIKKKQAALVLRNIFDTLTTHLSGQAKHLRTCQYDENVIVRAVWDRYGIESKRRERLGSEEFELDKVSEQRVTASCIFDGMIRSHFPLPQVHPRTSGPSIESEKPALNYELVCHGVSRTLPFKPKSIVAGHILGDPCEYGVVGFLLTNKEKLLQQNFTSQVAKECRLGRGLTSTFTWLAAQAYNQGFNGFIDLSYPLTSQTVISDGKNISVMACQLNTLELWKPDSANNMANLCWHTDEMPLYECIENGEVKGFNDEVLRLLANVFLLETVDRGYDMKPTISDKDTGLHLKNDFIPEKVEEVVVVEEEKYIV